VKTADYPEPFKALVRELRRLPGVGPRSAERMALWLLEDAERTSALAEALGAARESLRHCADCGFFSVEDRCVICVEDGREPLLCVVERATDILPIERSGPTGDSTMRWADASRRSSTWGRRICGWRN
jgi:recombination protein RecR